jgi:hypothetical protein
VTQGVRRDGGFSWADIYLDESGAVANRRVSGFDRDWIGFIDNFCYALFGDAPAKSK